MKKLILSLALAIGFVIQSQAYSTSITVKVNTMTNLMKNAIQTNGTFLLTSITVTAGASNTAVQFFDNTGPGLTNVIFGYSNILSYATNWITTYTNFYGTVQNLTNIALVDYTNVVANVTNTLVPVLSIAAAPGNSQVLNNQSYLFQYGIQATNNSQTVGAGSDAIVTVNYLLR